MLPAGAVALALLLAAPLQDAPPAGDPTGTRGPTAARGAAQVNDTTRADDAAQQPEALSMPRLLPGEVARIAPDLVLREADLDRYLGTTYARMPSGDEALHQLLAEALILQAADRAGITANETDVEAALQALDEQARAATDGQQGVAESLGESVTQDDLRAAVRLLVLHDRIVRAELELGPEAPIDPRQLQAWLDAAIEGATLTPSPLENPLAAEWRGGTISKAAAGNRLRRLIPRQELSGVLTEMIGVLLVRREAAARGLGLTPADATEEILQRNAALRSSPGADRVTYDQYLDAVEKRSLEELLRSEKFATEVLLRKIAEQDWTEAQARALWEQSREQVEAADTAGRWEDARRAVWRQLRKRSYTAIFQESRIARRF